MSRTIEAIIKHMEPSLRGAKPADSKRLLANWQNGFESGGHVQRKLRLGFTSGPANQPAN